MLVGLLEKEAVPFDVLHERYGSLLQLVRKLLGIVPNCDPYLEIWEPAFRSYNVMVPNLLNLPFLVWGIGAPRSTIGLAMYVSSRTAGCAYCSAHSCTFALRRGATVAEVAQSLEDSNSLSERDRAAVQIARALSEVPVGDVAEARANLLQHFSPTNAEWIVLAVAMMGWLNKTMDALGIPLEEETVSEVSRVITPSGWAPGKHLQKAVAITHPPGADSLTTRLSLIRYAPSAIKLDNAWTAGVPDHWDTVGAYLKEKTGHAFPVLAKLRNKRAIRAIATMIKDNLTNTVIGMENKLGAGLIYAETVANPALAQELHALGAKDLPESPIKDLARAVSTSPAAVDEASVKSAQSLSPAGIVELVTFIALLQLLHRLSNYYPAAAPEKQH